MNIPFYNNSEHPSLHQNALLLRSTLKTQKHSIASIRENVFHLMTQALMKDTKHRISTLLYSIESGASHTNSSIIPPNDYAETYIPKEHILDHIKSYNPDMSTEYNTEVAKGISLLLLSSDNVLQTLEEIQQKCFHLDSETLYPYIRKDTLPLLRSDPRYKTSDWFRSYAEALHIRITQKVLEEALQLHQNGDKENKMLSFYYTQLINTHSITPPTIKTAQ